MTDLMSLYGDLHATRAQDPALQGVSQAQILGLLQEAMLKQQRAAEYQSRPMLSGATGGFATASRNYRARKNEDEALSTLKDAFAKQQGVDQYTAQLQAIQQQIAEEEALARKTQAAQGAGWGPASDAVAMGMKTPPVSKPTIGVQNWEYAQSLPPDQREQFLKTMASRGVTVNTGEDKPTKFEEMADTKGAEVYSGMQQSVESMPMINTRLEAMEDISNKFQTGRVADAQAAFGAWMGTDAGSARDVWNAQLTPLKLELAKAIKGPMTEKEWSMLENALPKFGMDPRATAEVTRLIRLGMDRQMQNYQSATEYSGKNGHLRGWVPPNAFRSESQAPAQAGGEVTVTSPEEAASLPPGTIYVTPDGQRYKR